MVNKRKIQLENTALKTTDVFDTYWRFAAERQEIFFRRFKMQAAPWTSDKVLQKHKFTNAYRASDRISQYLIRNVIYRDDLPSDNDEVVFRIILFKLFNKIETWEAIEKKFSEVTFRDYSFKKYDRLLTGIMAKKKPIYSGAYIMPSGGSLGHKRKHRNHLALIEKMMSDHMPEKLSDCATMKEAFELILSYPTIGNFLAYQYVTDINYSNVTDFRESEFVTPGPGAIDGIQKCFWDKGGLSDADVIRAVVDRQEIEFERLGLNFKSLWGRRLQLIDCQNLFCEVDKYARVVHPEASGKSGRTRIKQKLKPNLEPIEYWFPPKWNINENIPNRNSALTKSGYLFPKEPKMDLRTYQKRASKTDRNPGTDEESRMIPLAGLASETGELLGEYKKYLRDGESHQLFRERLEEEVGDLLWYVANVATKFNLDLESVAEKNLHKCSRRWGRLSKRTPFDKQFPLKQRFPRKFSIDFLTYHDANGRPNVKVMYKGSPFGDDLTDNARVDDGYGYHDVIHLAFAAVLGWSPLVRMMIGAKRKDDPETDTVEDGGRAIATEEGLAAMIFAYVRDYNFLDGKSNVSTDLLRMIKNMVRHLEVSDCTSGEWESAIVQGFKAWRAIRDRKGGTVDLDLNKRTIVAREP